MALLGDGAKQGFAKGEIGEKSQKLLSLCQSPTPRTGAES
jgi:hypothetical protein